MASKRIAGTAYIKADGKQFSLGGTLTVSIDENDREGISGLSGVAGFKETPRVPFIEGDFLTTDELSVTELRKMIDVTVTAELANGRTYVLRNAWCAKAVEINASEGTASVRFEGMKGEEV